MTTYESTTGRSAELRVEDKATEATVTAVSIQRAEADTRRALTDDTRLVPTPPLLLRAGFRLRLKVAPFHCRTPHLHERFYVYLELEGQARMVAPAQCDSIAFAIRANEQAQLDLELQDDIEFPGREATFTHSRDFCPALEAWFKGAPGTVRVVSLD